MDRKSYLRGNEAHELKYKYKVNHVIQAHKHDVKAVAVMGTNIITGSPEKRVKLWSLDKLEPYDGFYQETRVFYGFPRGVSSLCVLPASDQYPEGLILAGSTDSAIYGFAVNHTEPVMKLLGHSENVCTLSAAGFFGFFISGSCDGTARVWSGQQCLYVLTGHGQAVGAAEFMEDEQTVLTGSSDHTIRMWHKGICQRRFEGHTDCIRGLAVYAGGFYSCSDDKTIRKWSTSHTRMDNICGCHSNPICAITTLSAVRDYATCGHDHKVKIWSDGNLVQTLFFARKVFWSIRYVPHTGDLAVGCSDGSLIILGKVPIDEDVPEEVFDLEQHIENKVHLDKEGEYDGQNVVCFEKDTNSRAIYSWDAELNQWVKKDIPPDINAEYILEKAKCREPDRPKKIMKFDVDVEGTMYQIAYEEEENPYDVAESFLARDKLPVAHVCQIADFIIQNCGNDKWHTMQTLGASKFVTYPKANVDGLFAKLSEFNSKVSKELQLSEQQVEHLKELANSPSKVTLEQMAALDIALMWKDEFLFPVLDLVRLAVRSVGMYCKVGNPDFINRLLQVLTETNLYINRTLVLKTFCNMFEYAEGKTTLVKFNERIISSASDLLRRGEIKIEKAGTALFLNYALLCNEDKPDVDFQFYCTSIVEFASRISDYEAIYRTLLAVVNVAHHPEFVASSLNSHCFFNTMCKFSSMEVPKTEELLEMLFLRVQDV